ncbi:hypothetical protein J7L48_09540 [bacterium]|nr:hypothetical protein [bacterium]
MRNIKIIMVAIALLFATITFSTDIFYQGTNLVSSDYFFSGIKNPASLNGFKNISYSVFLKNSFTLSNYGIIIPFDQINLAFGSSNCNNGFYNTSFILNHSFKDLAIFGISFNLLYDRLAGHNIYHNLNFGMILNPFAKEFKKQGQYIEMLFALYVNSLLNDKQIENYFPISYGGNLEIIYDKDKVRININIEETDTLNFAGNVKVKVFDNKYLFSSFNIDGVSLGIRYEYRDLVFMGAFLRNMNNNNFQIGLIYLPGNYKKVVIDDLMKLGLREYRRKNYELAKEHFMKARMIDKDNIEAKQYLQIIDDRVKLKIKSEVNYRVLHIMELLKKKKKDLAQKEFRALRKKYPEFEYKWKILYNKAGKKKVSKQNGSANKTNVGAKNKEYSEIKTLLEADNLKLAMEKFMNLKEADKNTYKKLGAEINKKIERKKAELLKDSEKLTKEQLIFVYEKILNELNANDPCKSDIVHYYMSKGEEFYRIKKYEEAIEMWQKVLKFDKNNSDAIIYIKTTQKKIGNK